MVLRQLCQLPVTEERGQRATTAGPHHGPVQPPPLQHRLCQSGLLPQHQESPGLRVLHAGRVRERDCWILYQIRITILYLKIYTKKEKLKPLMGFPSFIVNKFYCNKGGKSYFKCTHLVIWDIGVKNMFGRGRKEILWFKYQINYYIYCLHR